MLAREQIAAISVSMTVDERQVLMILLAADGTINRMGTGEEDNQLDELFVGNDGGILFEEFMDQLDPNIDEWHGRWFPDDEMKGKPCRLTVGLIERDKKETVCQCDYGTESEGPPQELCDFVISAVEVTDGWYEEQQG